MTESRWLWLRWTGLAAAALLLGLAAMSLRAVTSAEAALERAEAAFDRGELRESVREARRAAREVVPGASHTERAFARLMVIARGAEAAGDIDLARLAWEAVRGAAIEGAGFGPPSDLVARANENLVRLSARQAGERTSADRAELEQTLIRELSRGGGRDFRWSLMLGMGLVLALLGLGWAALRGVRGQGHVVRRDLWLGLALTCAGAVCWAYAAIRP